MAKVRLRKESVKLLGVVRRRRPALLVSTALCATVTLVVSLPAAAQPAPNAMPTGGVVFSGSAAISQSANQTTINQASQRAAINWQTFNVGSQAQVQFNQPNASSVALNRVTTPNPSQIAGKIGANGQIIIENQSGVVFYKGSQVNTAGLMVSAASSSDAAARAFLNGGKLVTDLAANPNAAVINQGQITIKQAGLAALVAPQVRNDGVIVARLGHVVLASGTETTLDLYGDGMMSIDVSGMVTTLPNGATALVTNTGLIVADGGTVQLTARAADGIVQTVVDAGGKIRANTIGGHVGTIKLTGVGGSITIEGQLDAQGTAPGTTGGNIVVNPSGNVTAASGARINASGQAGGGVVALGTTLKRAKSGPGVTATHSSANVTVAQGAQIAANATVKGNGGRVTVLSTGTTVMDGTIAAMGGPQGGNGGFVETSGLYLGVSASAIVNTAAQSTSGQPGTWLLDPYDIDITGSDNNNNLNNGTFTATDDPATVANTSIQNALATGNVVVTTTGAGTDKGNITVSATIDWSSSKTLSLLADDNITINDAITGTNGGLVLSAGNTTNTGTITIGAPISVNNLAGTAGSSGAIYLASTGSVVTTTGGGQSYNSPVVLQADATLTDTGNGTIQFASTVDDASAGIHNLAVNAGTGIVTFGSAVGGSAALASLTVTGPTTLDSNVTTTGTQTFNNAVTLGAAATLATTNSAVDFASTVDGGFALNVNAGTGVVTFGSTVGGSAALTGLTVTGPTTIDANVTTSGTQTFNSGVTSVPTPR